MRTFSIIVAVCNNNGIGINGKLPWKNKEDMAFFKTTTINTKDMLKQNIVVMGRNTFESMNNKTLLLRKNIVISNNHLYGVLCMKSLDEVLRNYENDKDVENIFVIGGAMLYNEAIKHPMCEKIYINRINEDYICDTFFPKINHDVYEKIEEKQLSSLVLSEVYVRKC